MMDGKTLRNKLVGSEDERAVSPVIGVILMVAITVILAAVIATLVMDFGDSTDSPINAQVQSDVDSSNQNVTLTVMKPGDASEYELRGAVNSNIDVSSLDDASTGESATVNLSSAGLSSGDEVNIIAIDGEREENAGSFTIPNNW
ncbi:archaeal flagellin-like protein [Halovivax ruber XH-70]|uniref:Archaeal flagellin-like protein n=1 Tax=Halovivax ruber (strain DSM 18193 / JCM 13892 / XH-70) TaxID=797302 RepID=L0I9T6_HALRX|nr:type IV pilin N-terminal domain-containing protein [Halovivax ruber]AGB15006.1 archaeal flagellin-like protein [Halovivax ruber XH-70]